MIAASHQLATNTAVDRSAQGAPAERDGLRRGKTTAKYEQEFTKLAFDIAAATGSAIDGRVLTVGLGSGLNPRGRDTNSPEKIVRNS